MIGGNGLRESDFVKEADSARTIDRKSKIVGYINSVRGENITMINVVLSRSLDISTIMVVGVVHSLLDRQYLSLPAFYVPAIPLFLNFRFWSVFSEVPTLGLHPCHFSAEPIVSKSILHLSLIIIGTSFDKITNLPGAVVDTPFMSDTLRTFGMDLLFTSAADLSRFPTEFYLDVAAEVLTAISQVVNSNLGELHEWSRKELVSRVKAVAIVPPDLPIKYTRVKQPHAPRLGVPTASHVPVKTPSKVIDKKRKTLQVSTPISIQQSVAPGSSSDSRLCHLALLQFLELRTEACPSGTKCLIPHDCASASKDRLARAAKGLSAKYKDQALSKIASMP
jgi:hypothetical protein